MQEGRQREPSSNANKSKAKQGWCIREESDWGEGSAVVKWKKKSQDRDSC